MKIVYTPSHLLHVPKYEVYEGEKSKYPEVPERIEIIANELRENGWKDFVRPKNYGLGILKRIHRANYVKMLRQRSRNTSLGNQSFPSYFTRDTYAPITNGTYFASKWAVNTALFGAELLKNGERLVYSLCRPPGHHAESVAMGGYCYFNNAAAAAEYLSDFGRVAILDIDYHHGNGTQNIFYTRKDVLYVSLHADPDRKYPYVAGFSLEEGVGEGLGYNKNYPLSLKISEKKYLRILKNAIKDVRRFAPDFLILSAGFDTYKKDPIGGFGLDINSYMKIGRKISRLNLPTLIIQEGGYYVADLGKMAISLIKGFERR
ncbi:MAG TPA: histone deacetylase family protein [Patescibacteria group bacterium]